MHTLYHQPRRLGGRPLGAVCAKKYKKPVRQLAKRILCPAPSRQAYTATKGNSLTALTDCEYSVHYIY